MGEHDVHQQQNPEAVRRFTRQVVRDVRTLEQMLTDGIFESDVRRIGAEQELFLVDRRWQPAPIAEEVLARNTDERLVSELTRFNLEFNLDPYVFEGDCLSRMEHQVEEVLKYVQGLATEFDATVAMIGILPTIHASDLSLDNMAPMPRYYALNDAIMSLKDGMAQYQIRGVDELFFQHDNIMVEGCNTSFQTHLQVSPDEFAHFYNVAQLVAAPVLAAASNSPVLFGKRLWRETRIALFQQAVDMRSSNLYLREMSPRVHFGTEWLNSSVTELYKEDIARFRVLMTSDFDDSSEVLGKGEIPKLRALQLHNGTVYRWNRACYGITNGKPHLRIENRILPSGPSVVDEMANAAFWFGLVTGMADRYDDIRELMDFDNAKSNFVKAARLGLAVEVDWIDSRRWSVVDLIGKELLPIARQGLEMNGIAGSDIDRYLGVIRERVSSRRTGSQWQLESLLKMKREGTSRSERLDTLVCRMIENQKTMTAGHTWDLANATVSDLSRIRDSRVEHFMTTDLFTVGEEELIEFVAVLMDWRHIRHVPVENHHHKLVGMVTYRGILRYMAEHESDGSAEVAVKDVMVTDPVAISPETPTREAIALMRNKGFGALPVVRHGELVGIVTASDFSRIAARMIDESLQEE